MFLQGSLLTQFSGGCLLNNKFKICNKEAGSLRSASFLLFDLQIYQIESGGSYFQDFYDDIADPYDIVAFRDAAMEI
jgi:hypothetical protein